MSGRGWVSGVVVAALVGMTGCHQKTLVEVFNNGPMGAKGGSAGYRWVDDPSRPTPGNTWVRVDPESLTAEQRKRIYTEREWTGR
jgi:hypothetical protein